MVFKAKLDWTSLVRVSDRRSKAASSEHADAAVAFVDITIRMLESYLSHGAPPVGERFLAHPLLLIPDL